jgi:putative ABC transport system substrate-binding protein
MKRRAVMTLLGGAAATSLVRPLAAHAQQLRMPVIGFLNTQSPEAFAGYVAGFQQGLKEAGYVEGQNVAIEYRWARGRYEDLPQLAADLVRRGVTLIATTGGEPAAIAAKAATSTIPIVFLIGGDPVQQGLVASFNRPGGNATGATQLTFILDGKRLGLLREMMPSTASVAVLANPGFPGMEARMREIEAGARRISQELVRLDASSEGGLEAAFAEIARRRPGALLVAGDPFFNSRRDLIVALAAQCAIPAIYEWREFTFAGGLMSYGTVLSDLYRQTGLYVGRVLKGTSPADLPVVQPVKFELIINLRTAKALGLAVPATLLAIADEVIE